MYKRVGAAEGRMASYGFRMREQNESNLMFEIELVCDVLCGSILPFACKGSSLPH